MRSREASTEQERTTKGWWPPAQENGKAESTTARTIQNVHKTHRDQGGGQPLGRERHWNIPKRLRTQKAEPTKWGPQRLREEQQTPKLCDKLGPAAALGEAKNVEIMLSKCCPQLPQGKQTLSRLLAHSGRWGTKPVKALLTQYRPQLAT